MNDDIVFSMTDEQEIGEMIDIDIISKYKILNHRGCEDNVPFYAKDNALALLLKTTTRRSRYKASANFAQVGFYRRRATDRALALHRS